MCWWRSVLSLLCFFTTDPFQMQVCFLRLPLTPSHFPYWTNRRQLNCNHKFVSFPNETATVYLPSPPPPSVRESIHDLGWSQDAGKSSAQYYESHGFRSLKTGKGWWEETPFGAASCLEIARSCHSRLSYRRQLVHVWLSCISFHGFWVIGTDSYVCRVLPEFASLPFLKC